MPLNQLVAYKIIWLEHLTVNQRVLCSSPRGGAKALQRCRAFLLHRTYSKDSNILGSYLAVLDLEDFFSAFSVSILSIYLSNPFSF